ncbi:MAG: hypothetical protein FJW85_01525 [Actinobacteria bacterium]|nr:hypothetical protein [Actinomycetota bacterium]
MDPASRELLADWVTRVRQRPHHHCGVFAGTDGDAFGHRARPWDYPDVLIDGRLEDDALVLQLSDGAIRLDAVHGVVHGDHPWGPGLLVSGSINGTPAEVWLV